MDDKAAGMEDSKVQQCGKPCQGGFRATAFVYVLIAFESMGLVANMSSLVLYFLFVMHFGVSGSSNTLTNFMGSTFMLALLGGFISDTYLTRLHTCLIFGVVEVLALVIITIQAHYPSLHPDPLCPSNCLKGGHAFMFYTSLALYALGAGGMRGALPALGGEQFDPKDPKEKKALTSYFNWFLLSLTLGASFGVTVIVKLGMDHGWDVAFFISMLGCVVGFMVLAIGKPFYRVKPPGDSPILHIIQVIAVSFRNRKLTLPGETDELYEINDKESSEDYEKLAITKQFRFLSKAAILRQDSATGPWEVCTVTKVEEVKVLTRMLPIIASTIIMNTCLAQLQTFSVQQGQAMNRFLGSFEVPASSVPVIPLVFMAVLIPVYEFVFIPVARKFTHHPAGITQLQRVGVGLVLSAVSMSIAAIVEVKRRNQDIKYHSTNNISLFWISFQYAIFGIADMFTLVGLMEFFYKEAPSGMKSLSTSFTFLSLSIGYFLSSVLVSVINSVTAKYTKHKMGWLEAQILNDNHLDLFYWFLAILSCINFTNYLYWASWYKYKADNSDSELSDKMALVGSSFYKEEGNAVVDQLTRERPSSPNQSDMKHEVPMGSSNQNEKAAEADNTAQNSSAEKIGENH